MTRWGTLFRGLTWKTVVIVFLVNMLIAGLQYWECWDCGDARYRSEHDAALRSRRCAVARSSCERDSANAGREGGPVGSGAENG